MGHAAAAVQGVVVEAQAILLRAARLEVGRLALGVLNGLELDADARDLVAELAAIGAAVDVGGRALAGQELAVVRDAARSAPPVGNDEQEDTEREQPRDEVHDGCAKVRAGAARHGLRA